MPPSVVQYIKRKYDKERRKIETDAFLSQRKESIREIQREEKVYWTAHPLPV